MICHAVILCLALLPFIPLTFWLHLRETPFVYQAAAAVATAGFGFWAGRKQISEFLKEFSWADIFLFVFLFLAFISTALTPVNRFLSLAAFTRLSLGVLLYFVCSWIFRQPVRRKRALWVLAFAAVSQALLGIGEVWADGAGEKFFFLFKKDFVWYGNHIRASGTFHNATIFSMFLEAGLPLVYAVFGPLGLAVSFLAILFSYTRAGIISAWLSLLFLARIYGRRGPFYSGWKIAVAVFVLVFVFFPERVLLRLPAREELLGNFSKPGVEYKAESMPVRLTRGETGLMRIRIKNSSAFSWPQGTGLARQWLQGPEGFKPHKEFFSLGSELAPQAQAVVEIPIVSPGRPGIYTLRYDIEEPSGSLLSSRGAYAPVHNIQVFQTGPWKVVDSPTANSSNPSRPVLWETALRIWRTHLWFGAGPESFKELSWSFSEGKVSNKKIHANNWYLQFFAELGLLGAAAFFLFLGALGAGILKKAKSQGMPQDVVLLLASVLTWFIHGFLDYFLWLPIGFIFWATLGMLRAYQRLENTPHPQFAPHPNPLPQGEREKIDVAILKTLTYADLFGHPLTLEEMHRGLFSAQKVSQERLRETLAQSAVLSEFMENKGPYFFLKGRNRLVLLREKRMAKGRRLLRRTRLFLSFYLRMPWVDSVFLSGGNAFGAPSDEDVDLFIVSKPGCAWTAYACAWVLRRFLGGKKLICLNYVLDGGHLALPEEDIFTAHQLISLRPLTGGHSRLKAYNPWMEKYFANAMENSPLPHPSPFPGQDWFLRLFLKPLEWFLWRSVQLKLELDGRIVCPGVRLEPWRVKVHFKDHLAGALARFHEAWKNQLDQIHAHLAD